MSFAARWFVLPIDVPTNARDVGRGVLIARTGKLHSGCRVRRPALHLHPEGQESSGDRTCRSGAPTNGADMTPQFRSGQTVRLSRGLPFKSAADGDYKIVRQLPDNGGEQQYRIKSVREPHERVVKESDLEKV
jgi:hypothetical protein